MKNLINKYTNKKVLLGGQRHKLFSNLNIILASFVLSFGINLLLIDGTNIDEYLKASIINSNIVNYKSDLSINKIEDNYYVVSNKKINNITNLSFSLAYNPKNIVITDINSNIGNITNLSNVSGINSIILTTSNPENIKKGDKLIKLNFIKKENKSENINILNANFKDKEDQQFLLSTSGLTL